MVYKKINIICIKNNMYRITKNWAIKQYNWLTRSILYFLFRITIHLSHNKIPYKKK